MAGVGAIVLGCAVQLQQPVLEEAWRVGAGVILAGELVPLRGGDPLALHAPHRLVGQVGGGAKGERRAGGQRAVEAGQQVLLEAGDLVEDAAAVALCALLIGLL